MARRLRAGFMSEEQVVQFLRGQGFRILQRNCRTRLGEVDIVARDGEEVVFVEVRSRSGGNWDTLERSVTSRKQRRIARAAAAFLRHTRTAAPLRFDVVAVRLGADGRPEFRHYRDAFPLPGRAPS